MHDTIAILDFGSQYSQLIARRVREQHVYCQLHPWDSPAEQILSPHVKGFILSGGPASVYAPDAPQIPAYILESGLPILGICYGMQALTHALGGVVAPTAEREYGLARLRVLTPNPLLPPGQHDVWMSHGDRIEAPPAGFTPLAASDNAPIAALGDVERGYFGVQFHPEVRHTPAGPEILRRFVVDVCRAIPDWTPASIIAESVEQIREQVGDRRVLAAISGGIDSSVATTLVHRAVGDQLEAVFVDNGLLRQGEPRQVVETFRDQIGVHLHPVNAVESFLDALEGSPIPKPSGGSSASDSSASSRGRPKKSACPISWSRERFTPMWSNPAPPTGPRPPESRRITTSAACPNGCTSS